MTNYKHLVFFIFIFTTSLFTQEFKIVKVINTNIFELESGQKVKFYGLNTPGLSDSNKYIASVAKDVLEWETLFLLNNKFKFEVVKKTSEGIEEVKIYKTHLFYNENLIHHLLILGYGNLSDSIDSDYYSELISKQITAQSNQNGIWKISVASLSESPFNKPQRDITQPMGKQYEHPYSAFLFVSAASFILAWDNFSSASDLQKTIDYQKNTLKNNNTSDLEDSKLRKSIVGVACLVTGIVTAVFSFKSVEVRTNFNSLSFNYNF